MQLAAEENLFNQRSYRCTRILKTARPLMVFMTLAVTLPIYAQGDSPVQLRQYIGQQVGGIDKLQVPAKDADRSEERRVGKECRSRWSPYH